MRPADEHVWRRLTRLQALLRLAGQRLFEEIDAIVLGEPRQQMLRPLEYEVPAQVREDDESGGQGDRCGHGLLLVSWGGALSAPRISGERAGSITVLATHE